MVLVADTKKRVPLHHKKRTGQHHSHGKQYSKPYWPYLPLLLVVFGGLWLSSAWAKQGKVLGYAVAVSPSTLLQDTNTQRTDDHEASLALNTALANAAQSKAEDMAAHDYWSHVSPSGEQPWQFITAAGYNYSLAGENLAYGFSSSDAVLSAWMHSAEHRTNILNGTYEDVGFGIANAPDFQGKGPETIVVAMYGKPAGAATLASADSQQAVLGAETTQSVSRLQLFGAAQNPLIFGFVTALTGAAIGIFIVRHALLWRRALAKSEVFVVKHRLLDIILVAMGILGFVLTRAAGNIG